LLSVAASAVKFVSAAHCTVTTMQTECVDT
jgi:hypothetical protein